jgi:hypothetical protein
LKVVEQGGQGIAWGGSVLNRRDTKRCRGDSWCECGVRTMGSRTERYELISRQGKGRSGLTLSLWAQATTGETAKQTRAAGRPSWGRKKGNGRKWTYLYHDKWTCTSPSPRLCLPHTPSSRHFPFPFLSAVFTYTIVD